MTGELWFDKTVSEMNRQTDRVVGLAEMYKVQGETIAKLYSDQVIEVVNESQRVAKEWAEICKKMTADHVAAAKANFEDAARRFSPLANA